MNTRAELSIVVKKNMQTQPECPKLNVYYSRIIIQFDRRIEAWKILNGQCTTFSQLSAVGSFAIVIAFTWFVGMNNEFSLYLCDLMVYVCVHESQPNIIFEM